MNRTYAIAAAFAAALLLPTAASAQTEADCSAGIEEVNTMITSAQGPTESERNEARELSEQASNAQSSGDYARCVELTDQAMAALASN